MQKLHLLPPAKVAGELLVVDSAALRRILPEELLDEAWVGPQKSELSPNITAMVDHFNSLALLVPTEVLAEATLQMRAKVISAFIKIAKACHQLRNYHSLKAVLAGLQCTPVYRLKRTWKRVPGSRMRAFQKLSDLMGEEGNCTLYQQEINHNIEREVPFVPYLGFFLTQIVHQNCLERLHSKHNSHADLKRRGALLRRYTIKTAVTVSRSPLDDEDSVARCDPRETLSVPTVGSCPVSGTSSLISDSWIQTGNSTDLSYPCDNSVVPNDIKERSANFSSKSVLIFTEGISPICDHSFLFPSLPPQHSQAPAAKCTIGFVSLGEPHILPKSKSAELLFPLAKNATTTTTTTSTTTLTPYGDTPSSPSSVLSEALSLDTSSPTLLGTEEGGSIEEEEKEEGKEEEDVDHPTLRHPDRGVGGGGVRLADSGVSMTEGTDIGEGSCSNIVQNCGTSGLNPTAIHDGKEAAESGPMVIQSSSLNGPCCSTTPDQEEDDGEKAWGGGGGGGCQGGAPAPTPTKHNISPSCLACTLPRRPASAGPLGRRLAAQVNDSAYHKNSKSPKELLHKYQIWSLGCPIGGNEPEGQNVRELISGYQCNNEMENYVLSYQREPP